VGGKEENPLAATSRSGDEGQGYADRYGHVSDVGVESKDKDKLMWQGGGGGGGRSLVKKAEDTIKRIVKNGTRRKRRSSCSRSGKKYESRGKNSRTERRK